MFLFYILIIQERKVLQAAVRFHLMQFCHSAECCQVFQTSISFLSVFLLFSSMEPRFFKQQYVFILCFDLKQNFLSANKVRLFCVFLSFNRMASKHVLPFCVYVIQQNGTQIIQAAIFS